MILIGIIFLIGIVFCSIISASIILASFSIGYIEGKKHADDKNVTVTRNNEETIRQMMEWINFKG